MIKIPEKYRMLTMIMFFILGIIILFLNINTCFKNTTYMLSMITSFFTSFFILSSYIYDYIALKYNIRLIKKSLEKYNIDIRELKSRKFTDRENTKKYIDANNLYHEIDESRYKQFINRSYYDISDIKKRLKITKYLNKT